MPEADAPFLLDGHPAQVLADGQAMLVRAGYLDLFVQRQGGRRRHVLRVEPGAVVLAMPDTPTLRMVVAGSRDAVATLVPMDALLRERPGTVEAWCNALARAADEPAPEAAISAEALAAFHERMAAALDDLVDRSGADTAERLRMQRDADGESLAIGLARLARTEFAAPPLETAGEEACLAACRLAADSCGLTLAVAAQSEVEGETVIDRTERIAGAARLRCRRVLLEGAWWRRDRGVMIATFRDARRPAVLRPRIGGGYEWLDVGTGIAVAVTEREAARFGVEALQCYPGLPGTAATPWRLVTLAARGIGRDAGVFAAMAVATGVLALAPPLAVAWLFSSIIPHAEAGRVMQVAGGLVLLAFGAFCFELVKAAALIRIEGRFALAVGAALTDRLLRLPVRFFAGIAAGDLADRLRGVEEIRRTLTGTTIVTVLAGVFSSLSLILLLWIDAPLALACAVLLAAAMAVALGFNVAALRWERVAMEERGRLDGFVVQMVIGIAKLRAAAAERRAMRVWSARFAVMRRALNHAQAARTGLSVFTAMLPLAVLSALFAGAVLLGTGTRQGLSLGDFMVFSAALGNLSGAVLTLSEEFASVLRVVPLTERALPMLRAAPENLTGSGRAAIPHGEIEFAGIGFRYDPDGPWAVLDLSLRIAAGEMVAIVGPSGSGKSTLLRLLLGFERPERGMILIDGTPLEQLDIGAVRRAMGVVLQQSRLSPGNIYQNIVGHSGADLAAAWEAARLAGLAADIEGMPMGMHTTVMENGQGLSGGQIQRLAIARALVGRPRVILLDEATSALDNRTQDIVSRSLASIPATRVVIAHRLSTIAQADRVFVLEHGRLVQAGGYDELPRHTRPVRRAGNASAALAAGQ